MNLADTHRQISAMRYPLDLLMGTKGSIRVLREMSRRGGQMSIPFIAGQSALSYGAAREAIQTLVRLGLVANLGGGRNTLYRLNQHHVLLKPILDLFAAEAHRFTDILDAIRNAVNDCGEGVVASWVYGSAARAEDTPESDLDIAVVVRDQNFDSINETLTSGLGEVERKLHFRPEIVVISTDDVLRLHNAQDPWWTDILEASIRVTGDHPRELVDALKQGRH